ncbi:MAG: hypothetical protein AAF754_03155 [Pseudomonadota bacterium]
MTRRLFIELLIATLVFWTLAMVMFQGTVSLAAMSATWALGVGFALTYGAIRVGMILFAKDPGA